MAEPIDKDARGATNLRIKFRSANLDEFIERYAVDVSKGGIFIRTREPLSVNTRLNLDFQLLEAAPLLEGEGTVVWIRQPDPARAEVTPGMGVRFDKLTPESQARLDKILEEKERLAQTGKAAGSKSTGGIAVRRPTGAFLPTESAPKPPPLPGADHHPQAKPASDLGGHPAAPEAAAKPVRQSPFLAGRGRNTGAMSTFRAGAAQAFEPPTADDIDKALSVLEDRPGPVPAMPPPPRLSQDIPIQVSDDPSNEPTRVVSDPQEFGVHEAVTGRAEVLPETGLPNAVPELKEAAIEDMTSRAAGGEEPTMAASPAAFAAAEVALGGGIVTSKAPALDTPLGVHLDVPGSKAPAAGKKPTVPPGKPGKPPGKAVKKGSIVVEPQAPVESGRFRTNATYSRPRTTEKRVVVVVLVLAAIGGAGFTFRHRLAAMFAKSEVAQLPVTPEPPPTPQPSAAADAAAMGATDGAVVVAPNAAVAPTVVEKPAPEPKPPVAKLGPPTPKPQPEVRAKKKPIKAAAGAIEVAPPPSEKPVPVAAETKPAGDTKPAGETPPPGPGPGPAKEPPLPPTPDAPAAPTIVPMLRIASVPTGARVLIDGVPAGNTPLSIKDIDPNADHTLSVQKDGFENQERQFGSASWTRSKGAVLLKMNIKLKRVGAPAAPGTPPPDPNAPKEGKPSDVEIITPDS